jgi:5-methylcytosine-specific restriction endonuclease McrA
MVIYSPAGGFVYMTPDGAMATLQSLQRREAVKLWKQGIKDAFDNKCAYCGVKTDTLTLDHVKPKSLGGEDFATNLVPACKCCNQDKGSQQWQLWYRDHEKYSATREWKITEWMSLLPPSLSWQWNNNCA